MKRLIPAIAGVALVAGLAGCASYTDRTYAYTAEPAYPARTTYYYTATPTTYYYTSTPARTYAYTSDGGYYANGVYHPPRSAWNYGTSSDNYYASRWDYYRNYQGIHGGPERTDGP
jgi:hypothetical protein